MRSWTICLDARPFCMSAWTICLRSRTINFPSRTTYLDAWHACIVAWPFCIRARPICLRARRTCMSARTIYLRARSFCLRTWPFCWNPPTPHFCAQSLIRRAQRSPFRAWSSGRPARLFDRRVSPSEARMRFTQNSAGGKRFHASHAILPDNFSSGFLKALSFGHQRHPDSPAQDSAA